LCNLVRPEAPRSCTIGVADARNQDDLDVVLPSDGEVLLEHCNCVQIRRRAERRIEHLYRAHPINPVRPPLVLRVRVTQQIPPPVAHDDGPRVDLHRPLRPRLGSVAESNPAMARACLHEDGRGRRVGPGRESVGGGCGGSAHGLGLGGHGLRERAHQPAERAADRVGGIAGVVVAIEHGHDQSDRLGGIEHQRRQPKTPADPVAAVTSADRLDRDTGLAKHADVAPGGPFGNPELVAEPVRRNAGAALNEFERQQRPGRRTGFTLHSAPCNRKQNDRNAA
jgi:hypothetical protein